MLMISIKIIDDRGIHGRTLIISSANRRILKTVFLYDTNEYRGIPGKTGTSRISF